MRNIVLNQVTLCADGSIGLQLLKQIVDNGEVLMSEPHRTVVDPFGDVAEQIAFVNAHLAQMGYPALPDDAVSHINALRGVHDKSPHVKAKKAALKIKRDAEAKAEEAAQKIRDKIAAEMAEPKPS